MAGLFATFTHAASTTGDANPQGVYQITAPANQKLRVWCALSLGEPTGATSCAISLRRGTTGGTPSAASTWVKENSDDSETVQAVGTPFTFANKPNNDGSKVAGGEVRINSDGRHSWLPVVVNGGETLTVFLTTTTGLAFNLAIRVEE